MNFKPSSIGPSVATSAPRPTSAAVSISSLPSTIPIARGTLANRPPASERDSSAAISGPGAAAEAAKASKKMV